MKHLNPRQGITILPNRIRDVPVVCVRCETPKSPPGDYNLSPDNPFRPAIEHPRVKHLNPRQGITIVQRLAQIIRARLGVKHLNPRQGITIPNNFWLGFAVVAVAGVKHLNPRQGITIGSARCRGRPLRPFLCETPKSPPGDYN